MLRDDPAFVKELDFVMEQNGELIGQNMFMRAVIHADDGRSIPILTMGPICICNELKGKGYGKILLDFSLEQAAAMGCGAVCFEGNIDFYRHAGFDLASKLNIHYHDMPRDEEVPFFLAQELKSGYFNGLAGTYCPPKGYFVADENQDALEDFDKIFPKKVKEYNESQLPPFAEKAKWLREHGYSLELK